MTDKGPSAYTVEQVVGVWQRARDWVAADPELQHDEASLTEAIGPETGDVIDLLNRSLRAAAYAERMVEMIKQQEEELGQRKKRFAGRQERMRATAFAIMQILEKRTHELPELTASIRKGAASVKITDETKVEDRFLRIIPASTQPDKGKIREALVKDGEVLDYAVMSNAAPYLVIGSK